MATVIRAVMFFADDPRATALWWADLLGIEHDRVHSDGPFAWFDHFGTEFGFHPADGDKNPIGASPVIYLYADSISAAIARAESKGASLHRGPLAIDAVRSIAQLVDPFGNVFGYDGSSDGNS